MSGYLKNFEKQIEAINKTYFGLIKDVEDRVGFKDWWVFGGGTALSMFYFQHRKSFDIDIFVKDAQVFDFLDPKWFIDESDEFDSSEYRFDSANKHLKLKTKEGIKVDFLLNEFSIEKPLKNTVLDLEYELYHESIEDIIAKKIKYRKEDNLTRDIFDLAVAIHHDNKILENLLFSKYVSKKDLQTLKENIKNLDKQLYEIEIAKIEPHGEKYQNIAKNAQEIILEQI